MEEEGPDRDALPRLLSAASRAYGAVMEARAGLYGRGFLRVGRPGVPVVSVGNITTGGTGKTPLAVRVSQILRSEGFSPAILSRGYGGSREKKGGLVSDGRTVKLSPAEAGDEPCLMALLLPGVPVAVGRDRMKSAAFCVERLNADVLILDDGFQRLSIARDLDILLADAEKPFGNRRTLPRGPLREPLSHILRAHALILTRARPASPPPPEWPENRPVFRAFHRPSGLATPRFLAAPGVAPPERPLLPLSILKGSRVMAFSGIARNEDFFTTLSDLGALVAARMGFPDHHPYGAADMAAIRENARAARAEIIVTT